MKRQFQFNTTRGRGRGRGRGIEEKERREGEKGERDESTEMKWDTGPRKLVLCLGANSLKEGKCRATRGLAHQCKQMIPQGQDK